MLALIVIGIQRNQVNRYNRDQITILVDRINDLVNCGIYDLVIFTQEAYAPGFRQSEFHTDLDIKSAKAVFRIDNADSLFMNDDGESTGVGDYLSGMGINRVDICGVMLMTLKSAKDGARLGFKTRLIGGAMHPMILNQRDISDAVENGVELT